MAKHLSTMRKTQVRSLGGEDLLEKEKATHSSILDWKIPWMEEPGGLQSMGSQSRTRLSDFTSLKRIKLLICLKVSPGLITILQDLDPGTQIRLPL